MNSTAIAYPETPTRNRTAATKNYGSGRNADPRGTVPAGGTKTPFTHPDAGRGAGFGGGGSVSPRYRSGESHERHRFLQMPKFLFDRDRYPDLDCSDMVCYALLGDRFRLSAANSWKDGDGNVYCYYPYTELQEDMGVADKTVTKSLGRLREYGLIDVKRQGNGKPNRIYVLKTGFETAHNPTDTVARGMPHTAGFAGEHAGPAATAAARDIPPLRVLDETPHSETTATNALPAFPAPPDENRYILNRTEYDSTTAKSTIQEPYNLRRNKNYMNNNNINDTYESVSPVSHENPADTPESDLSRDEKYDYPKKRDYTEKQSSFENRKMQGPDKKQEHAFGDHARFLAVTASSGRDMSGGGAEQGHTAAPPETTHGGIHGGCPVMPLVAMLFGSTFGLDKALDNTGDARDAPTDRLNTGTGFYGGGLRDQAEKYADPERAGPGHGEPFFETKVAEIKDKIDY